MTGSNSALHGTVLEPVFLLLHVNDLKVSCDVIKRADGLTLIGEATLDYGDPYVIQPSINEVAKWCADYNMTVSARKSHVLNISNKCAHLQLHDIPATYLNNEPLSTLKHQILGNYY